MRNHDVFLGYNLNMVSVLSSPSSSFSTMEVNAILVNGPENCSTEQAPKESLSPHHPNHYDAFTDSQKFPQVGKRYQAEIPPLMSISNYYKLQKNPYDIESTLHGPVIGSTIPLFWSWTEDEVDNMHDPLKHGAHEKNRGKGHYLIPGSSSKPWSEKEEASFILGLYIFGKSFAQLKRFIGNKTMGDILSFYYKKFYKSGKHQRWHECKNSKSINCFFGGNFFQPPSQQKLLSRLRPNVTQECYITILELSWLYAESKVELEDYVLALKALVGLNTLVEAVGIGGKREEDLTGLTAEKFTMVLPKIPVGKDCSRLTHREIINFLTHFTLSKARCSDLFWEAVWPRLLARGWHSEQQQGSHKYAVASSYKLLFFAPGVKKFSRKLEKGNHYFDSTSDILEKVVSNPEIIELPTISTKGNGSVKAIKLDCENSPDQSCHYHHKPRSPHCSTAEKKFTIVDTSMGTTKVIELGSSPIRVEKAFVCMHLSDDVDTQEEQANASRIVNTMCLDRVQAHSTNDSKLMIGKGVPSDMNTRRKITRTRLPTTKLLEALESEEYPKENRKRGNCFQDNSMPIPSRHTRPKVACETSRRSAEDFQVEDGSNVACDGSRKL